MNAVNIITTSQFASFAPEVDTSRYDVPTVSGIISQASQAVSDILGFSPFAEDITSELKTAYITTEGDLLIFPNKLPVQSLTSLSLKKGATSIAINLTAGNGVNKYNIDVNKRSIRFPYGEITLTGVPLFSDFYALRGSQFYVDYAYRGGWEVSELPSVITRACVLLTKDIFAEQYNASGATRLSQGGVSMDFSGSMGDKSKYRVEAERLLADYIRVG